MENQKGRKALVLSGGGVTGIAWELGILAALSRAGIDITNADLFVGTSAGSVVSALVSNGLNLEELTATQLAPVESSGEIGVDFDANKFQQAIMGIISQTGMNPQAIRAGLGKAALATETVPEATRVEVIRSRLGALNWPERPLLITAVDTENGDFKVFDRSSGVDLVNAVAASCAVPLVWPPVTIQGHRYMDGGMRSGTNADLALGYANVLILNPLPMPENMPPVFGSNLSMERKQLEQSGSRVFVIEPDAPTLQAIGPNVLDPKYRAAAAQAGLTQGQAFVDAVRQLWSE